MSDITVAVSTFKPSYFQWVVELLRSLESQTIDFQVILIVNSNKEYFGRLLDFVECENPSNQKVDVVFNPVDKGIAHSRNVALESTNTPYIAYTDDDAIPQSSWLEELMQTLELDERVGAATGPVLCKWEPGTEEYASWFPRELYWIIGCTSWNIKKTIEVRNGFASNVAFKKEALVEIGGFSEHFGYNPRNHMVGEEPEVGMRLMRARCVTLWNPNAIVYHRIFRERLRMRNILTRSFIEGKTKACLSQAYESALVTEANHLQSVIKKLITIGPLKTKALLSFSTIAVLSGYLMYKTRF
jgi:GT2 family glycosyltransferase